MKAVILAAGYGTRLQRDVAADSSGRFAHLAGTAKPLLPVGRCALLSHWVRALTAAGCVDCIHVVTNAVYHAAFEKWASHFTNVKILSDQTTSNEGRLGAVACLQLAVKHFSIEDHVLVIGGDTLFKEDFSLRKVQERFSELQAESKDSCLLLSYQCREDETSKYGILEVDRDLHVLCMKEKPLPVETESRRAVGSPYTLYRSPDGENTYFRSLNKGESPLTIVPVSMCFQRKAFLCWRPSWKKRRRLPLNRKTPQETLCPGSFPGSPSTFMRFLGVLMLETYHPILNVTCTSEKHFKMWSLTWCRRTRDELSTTFIFQKWSKTSTKSINIQSFVCHTKFTGIVTVNKSSNIKCMSLPK
ncbi:uncharacterized protein zgc:136439 isoform X1 [Eleginops maclovinus]|uniref:uncharacterized protein zgc:136439 isoform X1 n=1 Tax=Eleginops maclovinus TaxID=56733 RepID=UPI0030803F64